MLKGIETVVYYASDLKAATEWYSKTFNIKPNHESDYYVGFTVGGDELGLHPVDAKDQAPSAKHQTAYWSVENVDETMAHLIECGAKQHQEITDVGGGIRFGDVLDPFGNIFGVIQNPKSPNL